MPMECNREPTLFAAHDCRDRVTDFGGGAIKSDAGALRLGAIDKSIKDLFVKLFLDAHDLIACPNCASSHQSILRVQKRGTDFHQMAALEFAPLRSVGR